MVDDLTAMEIIFGNVVSSDSSCDKFERRPVYRPAERTMKVSYSPQKPSRRHVILIPFRLQARTYAATAVQKHAQSPPYLQRHVSY